MTRIYFKEWNNHRFEMGIELSDLNRTYTIRESAYGYQIILSHETICQLLSLDPVQTVKHYSY